MIEQKPGYTRYWVGFSTDKRPAHSEFGGEDDHIPIGSTIYEMDTGKIAIWDGGAWLYRADPVLDALGVVNANLDKLIKAVEALDTAI